MGWVREDDEWLEPHSNFQISWCLHTVKIYLYFSELLRSSRTANRMDWRKEIDVRNGSWNSCGCSSSWVD